MGDHGVSYLHDDCAAHFGGDLSSDIQMKTFIRKCVKEFKNKRGDFELKVGEEYLTSRVLDDGQVVVLGSYWVPVPAAEFFVGAKPGPGNKPDKDIDDNGDPDD